jgi:hypothetical protein
MAVGLPLKTTYANGDVYSASDVNDTNGTINLLTSSTLSRAGGKNAVINGGMDIWQRGTSSTAVGYGTADRWYQNNAGGTGTFAQETTTVPTGARYAMKFTASSSAAPQIHQYIETMQVIPMQGQTVTLSASLGASTSTAMGIDLAYTTSVDSGAGASWTTITPSTTTSGASVTTYQRLYSIYSIPSTATSLRIRLFSVSNIANTVVVYFGNVQLELGSTATTFSRAGGTIQGELAACQRYFERYSADAAANAAAPFAFGMASSTTVVVAQLRPYTTKRTTPTITFSGNADFRTYDQVGVQTTTAMATAGSATIDVQGQGIVSITATVASGLTQYRPYFIIPVGPSGNRFIDISAEL